ncbi:MAG: hypothetical protein HY926_06280, partial [Elusimicrobia bacterium]|nr:hypothetical protein [Elusimicrobiota bacterium]
QLEERLNAAGGGRRFVVVNGGVPGHNTAQILEDLEGNLAAVRPDLVILLAGMANSWNLRGYHARRNRTTWGAAVRDGLYRVRIFKLAKLLALDLRRVSAAAPAPRQAAPSPRPGRKSPSLCLGLVLRRLGNMPWAIWAFKTGVRAGPRSPGNANWQELQGIQRYARNPAVWWDIAVFFALTAPGRDGREDGRLLRGPPPLDPKLTGWSLALRKLPRVRAFALVQPLAESVLSILRADPGPPKGLVGPQKMPRSSALVEECTALRDKGDFAAAAERCRKAVELHPDDERAHCCLGLSLKLAGRHREAIRAFMRGIEMAPDARGKINYANYGELSALYFAVKDQDARREIAGFFEKLAEKPSADSLARDMLEVIREEDAQHQERISAWIVEDLGRIVKSCRRRGVRVLMQSYPQELGSLNQDAAARFSVPFVDHTVVFAPLVDHGHYDEYLLPDGHCSARGNGLVAETLSRKIAELGLLGGRQAP